MRARIGAVFLIATLATSASAGRREGSPAIAAGALDGEWRSSLAAHAAIHLRSLGRDTVLVISPPGFESPTGFEAACVVNASEFAGLARFWTSDPTRPGSPTHYRFLSVTRVDSATFKAVWSSDGRKAVSEESWRFVGPWVQHSHAMPPDSGARSLPAFGSYEYVETFPEAIVRANLVYPDQARDRGIQGTVVVDVLVGTDGGVVDARVAKSIEMLDNASLEAVRRWRFRPATAGGRPVATWVAVPTKYTIH